MLWRYDQVLKTHPNGMRFSVFDEAGDLLATNEYFRFVNCDIFDFMTITFSVLEEVSL
jgi:Serine dehydratase beta chain